MCSCSIFYAWKVNYDHYYHVVVHSFKQLCEWNLNRKWQCYLCSQQLCHECELYIRRSDIANWKVWTNHYPARPSLPFCAPGAYWDGLSSQTRANGDWDHTLNPWVPLALLIFIQDSSFCCYTVLLITIRPIWVSYALICFVIACSVITNICSCFVDRSSEWTSLPLRGTGP